MNLKVLRKTQYVELLEKIECLPSNGVFDPMVLRWSVTSRAKLLPALARCYNFGGSKGLSFHRVLVLPAESQMHFVLDGRKPFPEG